MKNLSEPVTVSVDSRKRVSLGKLSSVKEGALYLAREGLDGTIYMEPAMAVSIIPPTDNPAKVDADVKVYFGSSIFAMRKNGDRFYWINSGRPDLAISGANIRVYEDDGTKWNWWRVVTFLDNGFIATMHI